MEKEKFEKLNDDDKVIKIETIGGGYFQDVKERIAIQFFFYHPGGFYGSNSIMNSRINFSIFPLKQLIDGIFPIAIHDSVLIMANADAEAYALTYRITIDEQSKTASVVLEDEPEIGGQLSSDDEIGRAHV